MLGWVTSSATAPGVDEVRLPGERGLWALRRCEREGVLLSAAKMGVVARVAEETGLPAPPLLP